MNKHSNAYHKTIKMTPVDVNPNIYIELDKENNKKGPKFKLVIITEYQNIKLFLQMFLRLQKLKILSRGHGLWW